MPDRANALDLDPFDWFGSDQTTVEGTEAPPQPKPPVPIDQPHAIEDLAYGDLLYEFYQEHYLSAITKMFFVIVTHIFEVSEIKRVLSFRLRDCNDFMRVNPNS